MNYHESRHWKNKKKISMPLKYNNHNTNLLSTLSKHSHYLCNLNKFKSSLTLCGLKLRMHSDHLPETKRNPLRKSLLLSQFSKNFQHMQLQRMKNSRTSHNKRKEDAPTHNKHEVTSWIRMTRHRLRNTSVYDNLKNKYNFKTTLSRDKQLQRMTGFWFWMRWN